jgi:hypothetical protein
MTNANAIAELVGCNAAAVTVIARSRMLVVSGVLRVGTARVTVIGVSAI